MKEPDIKPDDSQKKSPPPERASENSPQSADSNAAAAGPEANASVRDQFEAARAERDANYDLYLRSQAELQNYRKRVQKEADDLRLYQALPLARDLLPALDNLHRALAAADPAKNVDAKKSVNDLREGVRLVARQIEDALKRHQVLPIAAAGKPFDPNLHQAIQQVPTADHPPMTVIQEVERGFTLNDRVVRPATVIVTQAPAAAQNDPATDAESPNADV